MSAVYIVLKNKIYSRVLYNSFKEYVAMLKQLVQPYFVLPVLKIYDMLHLHFNARLASESVVAWQRNDRLSGLRFAEHSILAAHE